MEKQTPINYEYLDVIEGLKYLGDNEWEWDSERLFISKIYQPRPDRKTLLYIFTSIENNEDKYQVRVTPIGWVKKETFTGKKYPGWVKAHQHEYDRARYHKKAIKFKPKPIMCPTCGKVFMQTTKTRIFCCDKCAWQWSKARYKQERRDDAKMKKCPICGTEFLEFPKGKKYCSVQCGKKAWELKHPEQVKAIRDLQCAIKKGKNVHEVTCAVCGTKFLTSRAKKYCSAACKKIRDDSKYAEYYANRMKKAKEK